MYDKWIIFQFKLSSWPNSNRSLLRSVPLTAIVQANQKIKLLWQINQITPQDQEQSNCLYKWPGYKAIYTLYGCASVSFLPLLEQRAKPLSIDNSRQLLNFELWCASFWFIDHGKNFWNLDLCLFYKICNCKNYKTNSMTQNFHNSLISWTLNHLWYFIAKILRVEAAWLHAQFELHGWMHERLRIVHLSRVLCHYVI